jgi:hypothetical protein
VGGEVELVDEFDGGFGWIADEFMERCSHAVVVDGEAWLIDPLEDELVARARRPAGVIQLLDRHNRDCAQLASRLGVPHHVVPKERIGPFEFLPVRDKRRWQEVALWWPERRVLVCADALGTADYFRAGGERLGVHPLLRLRPPRLDVEPDVILCGHGPGIFEDTAAALGEALSTSRRRIAGQVASAVRAWRRRPSPR